MQCSASIHRSSPTVTNSRRTAIALVGRYGARNHSASILASAARGGQREVRRAAGTTKRRPQSRRAELHGQRRTRESVGACSILDLHPTYRMFLHEISFSQLSIGTGRIARYDCAFFVSGLCSSGSHGRRETRNGGSSQSGAWRSTQSSAYGSTQSDACRCAGTGSKGRRCAGRAASSTGGRRRRLRVSRATVAGRSGGASGSAQRQGAC